MTKPNSTKYDPTADYRQTIPIEGMHCASCEILIADKLSEIDGVVSAKARLKTNSATIISSKPIDQKLIESAINQAGYKLAENEELNPLLSSDKKIWQDFSIGLIAVLGLYGIFQVTGLGSISAGSGISNNGLLALIIGLTAGFSTCMALIGGLVLGVSSSYAEKNPSLSAWNKFKPHVIFNIGRIISFILLGALIGVVGSAFALSGSLLGLLTILAGLVMLILGIKLTDLFPRISRSLTLPSSLAQRLGLHSQNGREYSHKSALLAGAASFFLPCGFTQAMQLLAVSTGDPLQASLIMGAFAIGTTPGLLSLGGVTSIIKGTHAQRFFRIIGVAVIMMAIVNLLNGLNLLGINQLTALPSNTTNSSQTDSDTRTLNTTYKLREDIMPNTFTTKVNQPTTLNVDVKEDGEGCMSTIMIIGLDDTPQYLKSGKIIKLSFTATKPGTYTIACAMGVPRGSITVTE